MTEYIKKQVAIEAINKARENRTWSMSDADVMDQMEENLESLIPSEVQEVKRGKWIVDNSERDWKDKDTYKLLIKCSECGKTHFLGTTRYQNEYNSEKLKTLGTYDDYTFCGKCGAKMHD